MNESLIFIKTDGGNDEVKSRARKLAPRLRTMLIMVDGVRTVADLRHAASVLGAPEDFLDVLQRDGLIAAPLLAAAAPRAVAPAGGAVAAVAAVAAQGPVAASTAAPVAGPAPTDVERFMAARKLINDSAVDALGFRVFLFTLKLEKCFTIDDLRALLPELSASLGKARGEDYARRVTDQVRNLLG